MHQAQQRRRSVSEETILPSANSLPYGNIAALRPNSNALPTPNPMTPPLSNPVPATPTKTNGSIELTEVDKQRILEKLQQAVTLLPRIEGLIARAQGTNLSIDPDTLRKLIAMVILERISFNLLLTH